MAKKKLLENSNIQGLTQGTELTTAQTAALEVYKPESVNVFVDGASLVPKSADTGKPTFKRIGLPPVLKTDKIKPGQGFRAKFVALEPSRKVTIKSPLMVFEHDILGDFSIGMNTSIQRSFGLDPKRNSTENFAQVNELMSKFVGATMAIIFKGKVPASEAGHQDCKVFEIFVDESTIPAPKNPEKTVDAPAIPV